MASTQFVYLNDQDISEHVLEADAVPVQTGEYGQLVINTINSVQGINTTGFWDILNPASPFYGVIDFTPFRISIVKDGIEVFEGSVIGVSADNQSKVATVSIRDSLQNILEGGVIYASEEPETPADAVARVCELYKINTDAATFSASSELYTANLVLISCNVITPDMTLQDLIQRLAEFGIARVWSENGTLFFEAYQVPTGESLFTFRDDTEVEGSVTLWSAPIVQNIQKDEITGYSITTMVGPAAYNASVGQAKEIDAGGDQPIMIVSLQAAVWIGEQWLKYLARPQLRIGFKSDIMIGRSIGLRYPVTVHYGRGDWEDTLIDIVRINNSNELHCEIEGVTR